MAQLTRLEFRILSFFNFILTGGMVATKETAYTFILKMHL